MNPRTSFYRKVGYVVAIGVLLMPLFWLSHPSTRDVKGAGGRPGGKLARLRDEYHLSQTELGQIDPTSETIKLATLGMRGVAADILWAKANNYQMKKDWTNLRATLTQISKLQPHFIAIWRHQAWNLSYNVSVAFDDYKDKFYWVLEGIKFLHEGVENNQREPRLPWDVAWFMSHKIGRADEAKLYRQLFRDEATKQTEYFRAEEQEIERVRARVDSKHARDSQRDWDNWLVGKEWFRMAEDVADMYQAKVKGMSDLVFYSDAPMAQINYAEAREKDGQFGKFGERTTKEWQRATAEWHEYGDRELPTTGEVTIRLNDLEMHEAKAREAVAAIEKLQPGLRQKIVAEKRARLKPDEIAALVTPVEKRTPEQHKLMVDVEPRATVTHDEVARRITGPPRKEALRLAADAEHHEEMALYVRRSRSTVNFEYWRTRAEMEQTQDAFEFRKAIYQGDQAFAEGKLVPARRAYEEGFRACRKVLDRFPTLREDRNMGEDVMDVIRRYMGQMGILGQLDEKPPKPFILQDIVDKYGKKEP